MEICPWKSDKHIKFTLFLLMFFFDSPGNIRKSKVFWCFQRDQKATLERKGLKSKWKLSCSVSINWPETFLNLFHVTDHFRYPLKLSENQRLSAFRVYRERNHYGLRKPALKPKVWCIIFGFPVCVTVPCKSTVFACRMWGQRAAKLWCVIGLHILQALNTH